MIRVLLSLLLAGSFALGARGSEPISVTAQGASVSVTQPHVTAELIPETTAVQAGQPFDVALHLHADAGWHTYWINPGDAGLATTIKWTLPPGFTAGPIQWPTPEKHPMGPLMTYGYAGDVYLLTTITPPKDDLPQHFEVKAKASWLVCQEECIPGKAELSLSLDSGLLNLRLPVENKAFFEEARGRLPGLLPEEDVSAVYAASPIFPGPSGTQGILIYFKSPTGADGGAPPGHLRFFPEQSNVLSTQEADNLPPIEPPPEYKNGFTLPIVLQQNGDKPDSLSGVLVSDEVIGRRQILKGPDGILGDPIKAFYINRFSILSQLPRATPGGAAQASASQGQLPVVSGNSDNTGAPAVAGLSAQAASEGTAAQRAAATGGNGVAQTSAFPNGVWERGEAAPPLGTAAATIGFLGFAFVGGLILNLMPCVLPVLSLKVFSLMKHAGENPRAAWIQGVAFTAGVVLSFWVLAGLLLVLRTAGNHIGWGFQMQNPGFVLALIFIFFLLGLNLFGVFELGSSLVGLDEKATGHLGGLASSFGNGALATVAATPCTAPFMGSALGFAAQQPAFISMLIFTFLALGMAVPYLLLTIFPGALRFVPKPGAWMEGFKQFMGFLLMATVIFLVYVFGALVGNERIFEVLFGLLLISMAVWLEGIRQRSSSRSWVSGFFVFVFFLLAFVVAFDPSAKHPLAKADQPGSGQSLTLQDNWQPWTQAAVDDALAKGRPVFVDFTAAWCLSCKVNEAVALGTDGVKQAFAEKKVALFRADWTQADPAISEALQKYNRDGVPLYLLYSPKAPDAPQILPAVLTPGIVLDALKNL